MVVFGICGPQVKKFEHVGGGRAWPGAGRGVWVKGILM